MHEHKLELQILIIALMLIAVGLNYMAAAQSISRDESLKPYTTCQFEDGLKVVQVDRLPKGVTYRTESTLTGEKRISLADGYRVMVAYPKTDFFANIKAEKSNPTNFAADKQIAVEGLKWAATTSKEMNLRTPSQSLTAGLRVMR